MLLVNEGDKEPLLVSRGVIITPVSSRQSTNKGADNQDSADGSGGLVIGRDSITSTSQSKLILLTIKIRGQVLPLHKNSDRVPVV